MNKITSKIKLLIETNALALATTNIDGKPHCIVVGYPKVVSGNKIILSAIYIVETIKNIQKNNNVSLVVWNKEWKDGCEGYELIGEAEFHISGKWAEFVKNLEENKKEHPKGAILINVKNIKKLA